MPFQVKNSGRRLCLVFFLHSSLRALRDRVGGGIDKQEALLGQLDNFGFPAVPLAYLNGLSPADLLFELADFSEAGVDNGGDLDGAVARSASGSGAATNSGEGGGGASSSSADTSGGGGQAKRRKVMEESVGAVLGGSRVDGDHGGKIPFVQFQQARDKVVIDLSSDSEEEGGGF